jgi:hypothetical protein
MNMNFGETLEEIFCKYGKKFVNWKSDNVTIRKIQKGAI